MKSLIGVIGATIVSSVGTAAWAQCEIQDFHQQAEGSTGPFELRMDYPTYRSDLDSFLPPTHFEKDWEAYLNEALEYAWAGQAASDFRVENNTERNWYHVPWLHTTHSGREKEYGLTRERTSKEGELQEGVDREFSNWGIGFFNEMAASELGKIWTDFCNPDVDALKSVSFPEGSMSLKVLFTEASENEIRALAGAPTLQAHIHKEGYNPFKFPASDPKSCWGKAECPREQREVTLLQVDIAIKDSRAKKTGWVFGTFVYDRTKIDTHDKWSRLTPISISWGNDPTKLPPVDGKSMLNEEFEESQINKAFKGVFYGWKDRETMGWGGRANGPVDNPKSGCISCHGSAQYPVPRLGNWPGTRQSHFTDQRLLDTYFKNIASGELADPGAPGAVTGAPVALDYSLQTQMGLQRMCNAWEAKTDVFAGSVQQPDICAQRSTAMEQFVLETPEPSARASRFNQFSLSNGITQRQTSKGEEFEP